MLFWKETALTQKGGFFECIKNKFRCYMIVSFTDALLTKASTVSIKIFMDKQIFSNLYYRQALFKIKIVSKSFLDKIIKATPPYNLNMT